MTKRLGQFQTAVLAAIRAHPDLAYTGGITDEIAKGTDRNIDESQIGHTIRQLVTKGLVEKAEAPKGAPLKLGRGRRRQYYRLTEAGEAVLGGRTAAESEEVEV